MVEPLLSRDVRLPLLLTALLLAVAGAAVAVLLARRSQGTGPLDNVLILSFDALRADHLGCYGGHPEASPAVDELAARGVRFARAHSAATWTAPAFASLFTGQMPHQHRVMAFEHSPLTGPTLAGLATQGGLSTAFFTGHPGLRFFREDAGFQTFDARLAKGADVVATALAWLDQHQGERFLLQVHLHEPHPGVSRQYGGAAVAVPVPARGLGAIPVGEGLELVENLADPQGRVDMDLAAGVYAGLLRQGDAALGTLVQGLAARGLEQDTLVVVTSDHGEFVGEHDPFMGLQRWYSHGGAPTPVLTHVPLIIVDPRQPARVVEAPVRVVDLLPTVLDALGLAGGDGTSLLAPTLPDKRTVSEDLEAEAVALHGPASSLVHGRVNQTGEMGTLLLGPDNQALRDPTEEGRLRGELMEWARKRSGAWQIIDGLLDEESRGWLRELGYIE